jgi:two-component system, OmpR family, alkaline phosphatase synthesis response regulator PhoP
MIHVVSETSDSMAPGSVLVVDDEPKVCELLRAYLERSGFAVTCAGDGHTAIAEVDRRHPDIVLLDLNLPGMDGIEVCKTLRKTSDVPIIMLTARDEEADRIVGLELGADDYVTKPFSPREVVARVKAVLRRRDTASTDRKPVVVGEVTVDPSRYEVTYRGKPVRLTAREFAIVEHLARNAGHVYSRTQLLDQVFGIDFEGYERTIDAHIKNIRQKLVEASPDASTPLTTVRGVGYKLEAGTGAQSLTQA